MNILHKLSKDDIEAVVGEKVANSIEKARNGQAKVQSGGGGNYRKNNLRHLGQVKCVSGFCRILRCLNRKHLLPEFINTYILIIKKTVVIM